MQPQRNREINKFINSHGWGVAKRYSVTGDASSRQYYRLIKENGDRAILMDAPIATENVQPFISVASHLSKLGFSAPKILAADATIGALILEDLGANTYTYLLTNNYNEMELYKLATEVLIKLHRTPCDMVSPPGVCNYNEARILEEVDRLNLWYLPMVTGRAPEKTIRDEYLNIWRTILPKAWNVPSSLILFDYHVDNLLLLKERTGTEACGLLDFQDAVLGPITYDLMSLLEDARRDVDKNIISKMKALYQNSFPHIPPKDFENSWSIMAAQRHIRVIGTFSRLSIRDKKSSYLEHLPRLWRYMETCLRNPILYPLREWLHENVPVKHRKVIEYDE
jgi:aminoglycoside/choline kinase family phosphotransferase